MEFLSECSAILAIGFPRCRRTKSINFWQKPSSSNLSPAIYFFPPKSIRTKQHLLDSTDGRTSSRMPISPQLEQLIRKRAAISVASAFSPMDAHQFHIESTVLQLRNTSTVGSFYSVSQFPLIIPIPFPKIPVPRVTTPRETPSRTL